MFVCLFVYQNVLVLTAAKDETDQGSLKRSLDCLITFVAFSMTIKPWAALKLTIVSEVLFVGRSVLNKFQL
jgi:hypothetical protein